MHRPNTYRRVPLLSLLLSILAQQHSHYIDAFQSVHRWHLPSRLCMSSTSTSWEKLTVPELKAQLRERSLPVSGNKAELIQRLTEQKISLDVADESFADQPHNDAKEKRSMRPPPKNENDARAMKKELNETIRKLESLKIGGSSKKASIPPLSDLSLGKFSSQQKELMDKMEMIKQSVKLSKEVAKEDAQQHENLPPGQQARSELIEHFKEQLRMRPANDLKKELTSLRLGNKGRKPDLVDRLAEHYVSRELGEDKTISEVPSIQLPSTKTSDLDKGAIVSFAGIPRLSTAAANALTQAFGDGSNPPEPTPIQAVAIQKLFYPPQPSAILHAPTGSGKTLTFLLPITESLWREVNENQVDSNDIENGIALILLPTRELAAQVAGVATVLAPKGMVRFVPRPMDLMKKGKIDAGEDFVYYEENGEEDSANQASGRTYAPRILIGSAKSISVSLFGDGKMPGTPTRKPDGKKLLSSVRWLVMDEVDRLLNVKKSRTDKSNKHEKPAALLAASIARLTMGRTQVIAASATVGRPLRREMSRVLGLHSSECPETLRGEDDSERLDAKLKSTEEKHIGRAVKIPMTVKNYVLPVDGSTAGTLLTSAALAAKTMLGSTKGSESNKKVLVVLTRNCDIKVHNALGSFRHFGIRPEPQSLLDALEADGSDRLMEAHRRVSGVVGVGGSQQGITNDSNGYLLITHEDNVRGLHLDSLDGVIVVGRPGSPDEYTHIAGRTGRAGRRGSVLNVLSFEQAAALTSWNKMLGVDFFPVDESELPDILNN